MSSSVKAVVIGGGVGGLAVANILAKAGLHVTLYEKNSSLGGRMGVLKKDGFTFDTGPSWYLMKDVFEDYFGLFNKSTTDYYELIRLDPSYKVFTQTNVPLSIYNDVTKNFENFEAIEEGAAGQLDAYIRQGEANYRAALEYFLYNPFKSLRSVLSNEFVKSIPGFSKVFSQSLHAYVRKKFKTQLLQQILEYPSVFLGASPFNTPALYQLMSYLDFKEGVYYPKRRGMYAVSEALQNLGNELGVNYICSKSVEKIDVKDGRATGVYIGGKLHKADIVVSNVDLYFTENTLLEKKDRSYTEKYWSRRNAGPSALLMYLGVRGELPELEHHNLFFVKEWRKNFEDIYVNKIWPKKVSMYVSKTTATDKNTAPKGHENIFVLVPLPATDAHLPAIEINKHVEHYLAQLEDMSGIHDLRGRIVFKEIRTPGHFGEQFNAWKNTALGMSHTLRQTAFLRPKIKSKKVENLYYVGAGTQPGIGVPMCLISAQLVYKNLTSDWSASKIRQIKRLT